MKFKIRGWPRRTAAVLAAWVLMFTCIPAGPVYAETDKESMEQQSAELEKKLKDLDAKIDALEKEGSDVKAYIDAIDDKIDFAQRQLEALREKVRLINQELDSLNRSITQVSQEIEAVEREVYIKQLSFDQSYEAFAYRLNAIYTSGVPSVLEMFLTSRDFSQFLISAQLLSNVSKADRESLEDLIQQMDDIRLAQTKLGEKKAGLSEKKDDLLKTKQELEAAKKTAEQAADEYEAQEALANEKLAKLQTENSQYGELRVQTLRDKERLDQKILDAIKKPDPTPDTGSDSKPDTKPDSKPDGGSDSGNNNKPQTDGMTWPAPKCGYITSRFNPNGINGRRHGGVDMAAAYESTGLPIVSADDGVVILTDVGGWGYSYGSYMMIRHPSGLVTLYAHCSAVWVKEGQKVKKGEQIGKVGNTGNSRGAHLHFEVRDKNGTRLNPLNYIQWGR